jgi:hypothetical protein
MSQIPKHILNEGTIMKIHLSMLPTFFVDSNDMSTSTAIDSKPPIAI